MKLSEFLEIYNSTIFKIGKIDLAKFFDVSPQTFRRWESEDLEDRSYKFCKKLAELFDMDVKEIEI